MNLNTHENAGARDMSSCPTHFPLLDLPCLILDRILTFLDKGTLRNLRAVCWTTKALVEQPKHLQRLWMRIGSETRLKEFKNSTVKWNSICVQEMIWPPSEPELIYLPLLQWSFDFLTRLKITGGMIFPGHILTILLNVGPQLRYLVCIGKGIWRYNNGDNSPEPIVLQAEVDELKCNIEEHGDTLQKNLNGLQHVELRTVYMTIGTSFRFLTTFLTCCPNLRTLNIPIIDSTEIIRNRIAQFSCEPLLDYLRRKLSQAQVKGQQPLLRIDLCHKPICSSLMIHCRQIGSLFPLTPSILIEMASLCQRTGVKLYNVPSSALPPSDVLTQDQKNSINETVASVLCASVLTGISDTCYIPPDCPVKIIMYNLISNIEPDLSNFQLPNEPINIVSIICGWQYAKTLVRLLFQRVWPTVTELQILNSTKNEDEVWSEENGVHGKLVSLFPNLKKLRLGSITIRPVFDFLDGLEDNLEMLYLGSVSGSLDLVAVSNWMSKITKMNKLKDFGLGKHWDRDPCLKMKPPGYSGKHKWHADN